MWLAWDYNQFKWFAWVALKRSFYKAAQAQYLSLFDLWHFFHNSQFVSIPKWATKHRSSFSFCHKRWCCFICAEVLTPVVSICLYRDLSVIHNTCWEAIMTAIPSGLFCFYCLSKNAWKQSTWFKTVLNSSRQTVQTKCLLCLQLISCCGSLHLL